jgi:hypothetical protein
MSTTPGNDPQADAGTEDAPPAESFMSHLVELRQRVVRAAGSVLLVFVVLSPFMKQIFDAVSLPLMTALPVGTKLLATGVISPFMVPLKVTLFVAFLLVASCLSPSFDLVYRICILSRDSPCTLPNSLRRTCHRRRSSAVSIVPTTALATKPARAALGRRPTGSVNHSTIATTAPAATIEGT